MRLLVPFIFFLILNISTTILFKQKFGNTLPVTLLFSTFVIYYSQFIFRTFIVGYYILGLLLFLSLVLLVLKRNDKTFRNNFFSNGLYCYIIICLLVLIIDFRRCFTTWDELSHWGVMVKEMIRLDHFYTEEASKLLVHKDYPPFVSLFEMLFCKLQGKYSEMSVTMGLHFLEFSLIGPCIVEKFKSIGKNKFEKLFNSCIFLVVAIIIILNFDGEEVFPTIYTDIIMPILYVYGISQIMDDDTRNTTFGRITILIVINSLILTKQMGIAFVLLFLLFYFLLSIKSLADKKFIIWTLVSIFSVGFNYLLWNHYTHSLNQFGQFNLDRITPKGIFDIIKGGGSQIQHETYFHFINNLFSEIINKDPFRLTYFSSGLLAFCLLVLIYVLSKGNFKKEKFVKTNILFFCGYLGYAFVMFVLYMYCFNEHEMNYLSSYSRYMDSFVLSVYLILLIIIFEQMSKTVFKTVSWKKMAIILGVFIILVDSGKLENLSPGYFKGEPWIMFRGMANSIQKKTSDNSNILYINEFNDHSTFFLNYYLNNRNLDARFTFNGLGDTSIDDTERWNIAINFIKQNDFIYVHNPSENMDTVLGIYTKEGTLEKDSLYKVIIQNDSLELLLL